MNEPIRIAVASGKGGTGKTTLATNLAWVAARQGATVAYLDCDVEEPNGHIFFKPGSGRTPGGVSTCAQGGCGKMHSLWRLFAVVPIQLDCIGWRKGTFVSRVVPRLRGMRRGVPCGSD